MSGSSNRRTDRRRRIGLILAPSFATVALLSPIPWPETQTRLFAIFVAIVTLWVTEALPVAVTALLVAPLLIATGIADAKTAFAPYADPLLFLFVGGFFLARAMARHGLDQRLASRLTSFSMLQGRPRLTMVAFLCTGAFLSMWISNTATAAILAPLLLGTARSNPAPSTFDSRDSDSNSNTEDSAVLLGLAYACSVGGLGTLMGSPPNGITARLLRDRLEGGFGFVDWLLIGFPAACLLLVLVIAVVIRRVPRALDARGNNAPPQESDTPHTQTPLHERTWTRGQRITTFALVLAGTLWLGTGLLKAFVGDAEKAIAAALPGGAVAILASSLLFFFSDEKGQRVLPWDDAVKIDWGIILLFGGGISLGSQMFETGLASSLAGAFVDLTGIASLMALTIAVTFFTIFFTEVCSNTASAAMLVPLVIAIADELSVSPIPPALAVGLAASCAFALPIATGPNAIVYGTGAVPLRDMMRTGLVLNLFAGAVICALLFLLTPFFPEVLPH